MRVAVVAGLRAVLAGPAVLTVAEEVALHVETAGAVLAGVGAAGVHVDLHNGQASPSSSSLISIPSTLLYCACCLSRLAWFCLVLPGFVWSCVFH